MVYAPIRRLALVLTLLLAAGAGVGASAAPGSSASPGADSGWHCEQDADGAWTCVEDEAITAAPQRATPAAPAAPATSSAQALERQVEQANAEAARRRAAAAQAARPPARPAAPTIAQAQPAAAPTPAAAPAVPPPEERVGIMNLPDDYYTVQLLALSTREGLEAYAREHNLYELSAARIESGGELRFVLLMGAYPTVDAARNAATLLPEYLQELGPWIRTLASLKAAMRRADAMIANGN